MQFEDLCIGYRTGCGRAKVVASGLSATLHSGRLTCLLGRNGTGKSTLLRTLAGLQRPLSEGNSNMQKVLSEGNGGLPAVEEVAVVLTDRVDVRNISVSEVVALGRTPYTNFWGTLTDEDRAAVGEALRLVGIEGLRTHDMATLSDGERQKVMIAKALAQQTPIILLDEPTAFLDYPSKRDLMRLLRQLAHEQQKAILLSTHDVEMAREFADDIWLMDGSTLLTAAAHDVDIQKMFS